MKLSKLYAKLFSLKERRYIKSMNFEQKVSWLLFIMKLIKQIYLAISV